MKKLLLIFALLATWLPMAAEPVGHHAENDVEKAIDKTLEEASEEKTELKEIIF